jgi:hypothetical protein
VGKLKSFRGASGYIPFPVIRLGSNEETLRSLKMMKKLIQELNSSKQKKEKAFKDSPSRMENAKKLSDFLDEYEDTLNLIERKDALDELLKNSSQMNFTLQLETEQKPALEKKIKEGEKLNIDKALRFVNTDFTALKEVLYRMSRKCLERIKEPAFDELRSIVQMKDETEIKVSGNKLELKNVYTPPVTEALRKDGGLPYCGTFAPYRGGWYEAARMHRAWFETTPWFKKAAARDFSKLREIALWMWSRGGVSVSEPPVHWFMKETGLKVGLDWYWWHGIPYDTSFPYFWPPRDGVEGFRAAVGRMKKAGAFVQTYTNGASWDCDDPRWAEGGMESVVVKPDGDIFAKMYNVFTRHRLARMCGEAPKFQSIIRRLERNLRESGLDGVYMDQITCGAHSPCHNPRHAHAPGGDAAERGFRAYVQAVRDDNPGFILSSEATSETYFDMFEASIMLYSSWERCGKGSLPEHEPVPAATVIYRGANVIFGSFATPGGAPAWDPMWGERPDTDDDVEKIVSKYPEQFAVEFARGIVWGIQPMVHNFTMKDVANPRIADDLRFMKDSARFYFDNRDVLFDGEMLKPARLTCASKRVEFLSASCYRRVKDSSVFVQEALPCVFHSEWKAKDGRRAAILVNWTREEQPYELDCEGVKRTGTLAPLSWKAENLRAVERK